MSLSVRKSAELAAKVASLRDEFKSWEDESADRGHLEKHHTQIRAVTETLQPFVERVESQLARAGTGQALLGRTERIEEHVLDVHRIWEFFRAKLALRYVPLFADYLGVADDFAWECYRRVTELRKPDERHEPPLVFFNSGWSPLTWPRGTAYISDEVGKGLDPAQFAEALRRLPIHMIGIPWYQIAHFPDAAVIGHEVGHDVEAELGLGPRLAELVETALVRTDAERARIDAWKAWLSEVFADVYGTLATGPAYTSTLTDFLAAPEPSIARERPAKGGTYPTRWLRVRVTVETLRQRALDTEANRLDAQWTTAFPNHSLTEFEADVPNVVEALLQGPYEQLGDNKGLIELLDFGGAELEGARAAADEAGSEHELEIESKNVRCLVAAARLAFDADPATYEQNTVASALRERIMEVRTIGTRALSPEEEEAEAVARSKRNASHGRALLELIEGV